MLRLPVKMLHRRDTSSLPSILWTQHRVAFSSFATTHAIVLAPIHFVVISFPTMLTHRLLLTSLCLGIWFCSSKACVFHLSLLNFLVLISKYFSSLPRSFWILPPSSQVLTKSPSLMSFSHFVTVSKTIQWYWSWSEILQDHSVLTPRLTLSCWQWFFRLFSNLSLSFHLGHIALCCLWQWVVELCETSYKGQDVVHFSHFT